MRPASPMRWSSSCTRTTRSHASRSPSSTPSSAASVAAELRPSSPGATWASEEGGPYFAATRESIISREYPLARATYAFIDVPPGKPIDAKVREFLRYVLSREGQADVERDRGYLPLGAADLAAQRAVIPAL